jgi:hypothetical protein
MVVYTGLLCVRACVRACVQYAVGSMSPAGGRQHRRCIIPQAVTHSLVLLKMGETKHFELIGIINKPLLLHLVGCLYYLYQWCTVKQMSDNEIYLLIKYIKSVLCRVAKHLSHIEYARCLKVKNIYCCLSHQAYYFFNICWCLSHRANSLRNIYLCLSHQTKSSSLSSMD